jgi:Fe-S-cluster containining protein
MGLPAKDQELVQIVDAALADASRRAGDWLVCRVGCTQCCHGAFAINELDALRLQAGMDALRVAEPEIASQIERRSQAWIEVHGADYPGDLKTGKLGESEADRERFEEFANEAACPALDPATGRCDVYAWRPMTCRVFGPPVRMESGMGAADADEASTDVAALGHCELCFHGASEDQVKECEMTVPHEREGSLLDEVGKTGETVVAFAFLR